MEYLTGKIPRSPRYQTRNSIEFTVESKQMSKKIIENPCIPTAQVTGEKKGNKQGKPQHKQMFIGPRPTREDFESRKLDSQPSSWQSYRQISSP